MVIKDEFWSEELNFWVRMYIDINYNSNTDAVEISRIVPSNNTVIDAVLRKPTWDKLVKIHGKDWGRDLADAGTLAHIMVEQYIDNEDFDTNMIHKVESDFREKPKIQKRVYDKYLSLIQSEYIQKHKKSQNYETERMLVGERFAGTVDFIDYEAKSLRDWKTGSYSKMTYHFLLQLTGYLMLCAENFIDINDAGITCTVPDARKHYGAVELEYPMEEYTSLKQVFNLLYNIPETPWEDVIRQEYDKPIYGVPNFDITQTVRKEAGYKTKREIILEKYKDIEIF